MTLNELKIGQSGVITAVGGDGPLRCRLLDMGLITKPIQFLKDEATINTVIIISVSWEITLDLEINCDSVLITHWFHLSVFDCTQRVDHMRESCNTCCKCTSYICINKSHLCCFVVIFIMHIVDHVQGIYI